MNTELRAHQHLVGERHPRPVRPDQLRRRVQTDMVMAIREDVRAKIVSEIPAGRLAMPEEVADAVAFLASENAAYITGTNLSVNGGLHMYA